MRAIKTEPSDRQLNNIYRREMSRAIVVDGVRGVIENGPGGWGDVAIIVTLGMISITARGREYEDYENLGEDETPDVLQVYRWQREDLGDHYYYLLADALHDVDRTSCGC